MPPPRRLSPLARIRAASALRRRKRAFEHLVDEVVTATDAERIGLPPEWFQSFARERLRREEVRVEHLLPWIDDPSIHDLLRYVEEQRRFRDELRELLDRPLSGWDVIAAGYGDASILAVQREVFPDRDEASVREWIPHAPRPAVAGFLSTADGRPSPARVERVLAQGDACEELRARFGALLDRAVDVEMAVQSGAGSGELRGLVREWFGKTQKPTLEQLLRVRHVEAFARLLDWHAMMLGVTREERAELARSGASR